MLFHKLRDLKRLCDESELKQALLVSEVQQNDI